MRARLRIDPSSGEMRLIDELTNEPIENLMVTKAEVQNEHVDHFTNRGGTRRVTHRVLVDRKIVLTVEVLVRNHLDTFDIVTGPDTPPSRVHIDDAVRYIRFPRVS